MTTGVILIALLTGIDLTLGLFSLPAFLTQAGLYLSALVAPLL